MKKVTSALKKGFTLIELLVVIAIIGLLSSIVLASLSSARQKAKNAKYASEMKQLVTALKLYREEEGDYPTLANVMYTTVEPNQSIDPGLQELVTKGYIPAIPVYEEFNYRIMFKEHQISYNTGYAIICVPDSSLDDGDGIYKHGAGIDGTIFIYGVIGNSTPEIAPNSDLNYAWCSQSSCGYVTNYPIANGCINF